MATCLYKPKPCDICGRMIPVGEECEYIAETKTIRHYGCRPQEASEPSAEDIAKADRLGFVEHTDESIRGMAPRWILWNLREADRGASAGRPESSPHRNTNAPLFGE